MCLFSQERAEGRALGVNVDRSPPVVLFRDSGELQASVQNLDQFLLDDEEPRFGGQTGRDRLVSSASVCLMQQGKLVGEPGAKVGGEVVADLDGVPFAVLLVGRIEFSVDGSTVEPSAIETGADRFSRLGTQGAELVLGVNPAYSRSPEVRKPPDRLPSWWRAEPDRGGNWPFARIRAARLNRSRIASNDPKMDQPVAFP
jgi:hypothetical protein